jgi:membrane protease YdiL (CAAX protease family)
MNDPEIPPLLEPQPPPLPKRRAKWRWAIHLLLLAAYVLGMGLISKEAPDPTVAGEAALPTSVSGLLVFCAVQLVVFGIIFAVALLFSRASVDELRLRWRGGFMPVLWGGAHSILLRVAIAIAVMIIILPMAALKGEEAVKEKVNDLRPKVETLIEPKAMNDPFYFATILSVVSFVVAGLREELWRAGMLAGLAALFPSLFASRKGQFFAVIVAAVVFGFGHLPQGAGAVALTGLLGVGLGLIMVWHRSIWEAVIAHGFFDATSFALLWILTKVDPNLLKSFGIS